MKEFFKGWKRKTGVVTLAIACIVAIPWVRNQFVDDGAQIWYGQEYLTVTSGSGTFRLRYNWMAENKDFGFRDFEWGTLEKGSIKPLYRAPMGRSDGQLWNAGVNWNYLDLWVQYWSIVIPLTLLSVWLLLSKQPPVKQPVESSKDQS